MVFSRIRARKGFVDAPCCRQPASAAKSGIVPPEKSGTLLSYVVEKVLNHQCAIQLADYRRSWLVPDFLASWCALHPEVSQSRFPVEQLFGRKIMGCDRSKL